MAKAYLFVLWLIAAVCPISKSFVPIVVISKQVLTGRRRIEGEKPLLATPTQITMSNVAHAKSLVDCAQAMNERAS